MGRMKSAWLFGLGVALSPILSFAQGLHAVRAVPGLACMLLDNKSLEATQQSALPPVFAEPSRGATRIGYPSSVVFVRWPLVEKNGFVAMVRLNGQPGWIAGDHLQPWHPMNGGNAKCTPSLMSNGRLGTSIR